MAISVGDSFPKSTFKMIGVDGPENIYSEDILRGRKIVLFAVPGAFTPTCHLNHLPGFLDNLEVLKSKGIDDVYVLSVNDVWVMDAWSTATGCKGRLGYLSDGSGEVTRTLGLDVDLGMAGMGLRSKRYSMILDDGVVQVLNIEEKPGQTVKSGAATILEQL